MYILYGGPHTRAILVEMVLAEGDIAYELRVVDTVKQEHRAPAYLAINPAGWVPALITPEGETLIETPAINLILAERHGLTQLAPRIDEPERGQFLCGLFYLTDELEPTMKRYFYPHRYVVRVEDGPAMKSKALADALDRFAVIDRRLSEAGPYHLGARYSLVDLTMAHWAATLETSEVLAPYPALRRCMDLVIERPKVRDKFATLKDWRDAYVQMQARGAGVD